MKFVWDTSSLSHAFESFFHASASAYVNVAKKFKIVDWDLVKRSLRIRLESESNARRLLTLCDNVEGVCLVPREVFHEVKRDKWIWENGAKIVFTDQGKVEVEKWYSKWWSEIAGFSKNFKLKIHVKDVDLKLYQQLYMKARSLGFCVGTSPTCISETDFKAVVLAYQENATLVTADRKIAELCRKLGVNVIYTPKPEEYVKLPQIPTR